MCCNYGLVALPFFQILSREHWTPDNARPAVLAGTDVGTSASQTKEPAPGFRNSPVSISFLLFFSSLENTRKLSSTLETPSRLIPATTRSVGPPLDDLLFKKMLNWGFFKALQWREISFSARRGPFIVTCTSPSHPPLLSACIPRPSWLQAAWCRPTATLMWPWTSTAWRPARCPRALLSGTTSACVSLGKRNMLLWVALFLSSSFHFSSIVFFFFFL